MKKPLLSVLLLALFSAAPYAGQQPARLFDSFGDVQLSDLKARLDGFAIELQNNPVSRGCIVIYPAANKYPGSSLRRADAALEYLVATRGMDARRLSLVIGGFRDKMAYELWLVAPDSVLPVKPFDLALTMAGEKAPMLFDSFPVIERGDPENTAYEDSADFHPDAKGLYDRFVYMLREDRGLRGCVIAYGMPRRRGTDRGLAARVKLAIAKAHAVDLSRIVAIGGGMRERKMVELWLVPPGAELPKPTPTVRAARRKRR